MGLDMYLEARKYVRKVDYSSTEPETTEEYKTLLSFFPPAVDEFNDFAGAEVQVTIGYWRKANQVHNWFVTKCAGGVDECQPIRVDSEQLAVLRGLCQAILDAPEAERTSKANELLPTTAGFFFGSTEVDEWYFEDLRRTVAILDKAIALDDVSLIYQASW